ncbi:GFA family protein [Frigidibacter oleivorans]|uniref:GFA family protein n=1 Tax=Frigidibacter oleivorans TaxID=2487129 RepID=UPI000F8ED99A|nr:GFA family protein [Frigidibacter oleivorans]
MAETRTGHCLCGGVSITVTNPSHELGACHCEMCRRWTGLCTMALGVAEADLAVEGAGNVAAFRSSDWAERCFCRVCGSTLWYHLTIPGQTVTHYVAAGLFDDLSGMHIGHELFFDRKPDAFAFAGDSKKITEAEFLASVASPEE